MTVGHSANLHGCSVEDRCLIGIGAILLNGVQVGTGSIVAAGALVTEGTIIPPGSLYLGVPARRLRAVTPEETRMIEIHADNYLGYKEQYRQ